MEVRPGYKWTEIGVIPKDWEVQPLSKGIELLSGHHVLAKHCNTDGDGIPYITGPADFPNGVIQHTKYTTSPTTICHANDILVTVKGSGAGTLVLSDAEYCISRQLMAIRVNNWSTDYIYFSLLQNASLFSAAATGLIPGLSRSDILNKALPLPPTPVEQRAIAAVLSDVDALIAALDRLIAKKRAIKQGAMQQLLTGRTRLPEFGERQVGKHTTAGVIPGDWEVKEIEEIADVKGGKRLPLGKSLSETETPYPYIRVTDMFFGGVHLDEIKYVPEDVFPAIKNYTISSKDIFISVAGTLGIVGKIPDQIDGANLTENADKITNIQCDRDFLLHTLMTQRIQSIIEAEKTVGAQPKLALGRIQTFIVAIPPTLEEQRTIAAILSDMDAEIAALQARRDKTRALKQGLMQELLTGRIRLVGE